MEAEYHKFHTAGQPIIMTCYECQTKTLTFNETTRTWFCPTCQSLLTTDSAVERIASEITGADWTGAATAQQKAVA